MLVGTYCVSVYVNCIQCVSLSVGRYLLIWSLDFTCFTFMLAWYFQTCLRPNIIGLNFPKLRDGACSYLDPRGLFYYTPSRSFGYLSAPVLSIVHRTQLFRDCIFLPAAANGIQHRESLFDKILVVTLSEMVYLIYPACLLFESLENLDELFS